MNSCANTTTCKPNIIHERFDQWLALNSGNAIPTDDFEKLLLLNRFGTIGLFL